MQENTSFSPKWETQIVALLLLFFLAQTALGEACGSLQAEVKFDCKAISPSFVTTDHPSDSEEWTETLNGGSSCVDLESRYQWEGFTSRQTAIAVPSNQKAKALVVSYSNDPEISGLSSGVHVGDTMIGIKISRTPSSRIVGRGGGFEGFKTRAVAFVKPVITHGVFVPMRKKGDSLIPDVVVEGDHGLVGTSMGPTHLICGYQVSMPK